MEGKMAAGAFGRIRNYMYVWDGPFKFLHNCEDLFHFYNCQSFHCRLKPDLSDKNYM